MTKVIYSGFFGKWSSIIEILKTKYKWNPQSIFTRQNDVDFFKEKYDMESVYTLMDLRKGVFPDYKFKKIKLIKAF